jgi:hypothetical protein
LMNLGGNFDVCEILLEHLHRGIERSHVNRKWQTLFRSQIRNLEILDTRTHARTRTHTRLWSFAKWCLRKYRYCNWPIWNGLKIFLKYLFQYPK